MVLVTTNDWGSPIAYPPGETYRATTSFLALELDSLDAAFSCQTFQGRVFIFHAPKLSAYGPGSLLGLRRRTVATCCHCNCLSPVLSYLF